MNATILALIGYIGWTLTLLIALGTYRTLLVLKKQHLANTFKADGSDVPALGLRLTRAYANCTESFAFIGGTMLLALATGSSVITDKLAYVLLLARLAQSITHVISTSVLAVQIRFALFLVQVGICIYWLIILFDKFTG